MTAFVIRGAAPGHGRIQGAADHHALGVRLFTWIREAAARHGQRRALAQLDDRLLADVGISREQARREMHKPCWRD